MIWIFWTQVSTIGSFRFVSQIQLQPVNLVGYLGTLMMIMLIIKIVTS
jgi:hypothetical protein